VNGVTARQLVWSDPLIQKQSDNFIAVADELHDLRTGSTPEALFFQRVFQQKQRHAGHQGVFIATPSGRLLASGTTYTADSVTALIEKSLVAWTRLPVAERYDPDEPLLTEQASGRAEDFYPEDGLVLRVTTRDLPAASLDDERIPRWHRYFLWLDRDEMLAMLPSRLEPGQKHVVPRSSSARLATLALLDKGLVDGFTKPFRDSDVEQAQLELTVVEATSSEVRLQITGSTSTKTRDAQAFYGNMPQYEQIPAYRGVRTKILGNAVFDRASNRFSRFDMVAVGLRFGGAYVGRPPDDWNEKPIGFSLTVGNGSPAERIAPEFPERYPWIITR